MSTRISTNNISTAIAGLLILFAITFACKSSGGILGPVDETTEAAKLVAEANQELTKIKVLYRENEGGVKKVGKRIQLKKALEAKDKEQVQKITDEIIQLIDEGTDNGQTAIDKIQQARDMQINPDYQEYLRLKEEALKKQLEAFTKYRQAAQSLRTNYDPQNDAQREKVTSLFEEQSNSYRDIMEKARDNSSQANELYKAVMRRQAAGQ